MRLLIGLFFQFLVLCLFVRMILSWLPLSPGNRFVRFFFNITSPLIDPVARRLPRMSIGMFDVGTTVAFIFSWWAITILSAVITSSIP